MPKKTKPPWRAFFDRLPIPIKCLFGRCKDICGSMAMEEDLRFLTSFKLKIHIALCSHCAHYYQQMLIVNEKIKESLQDRPPKKKVSDDDLCAQEKSIVDSYLS